MRKMAYFICNGNKIFYNIKGNGRPLLFIHGWATTSRVWEEQINYFSKNYKVIYFDLSGFGKSINSKPITLDNLTRDLTCLIDYLSLKKVILIGWSLGALVSLKSALSSIEPVESLVLVGATARFTNGPGYNAGLPGILLKRLYKRLERDTKRALADFYTLLFSEKENCSRIIPKLLKDSVNLDRKVLLESLNIFFDTDLRNKISNIKLPTLIIHGDSDQICPVSSADYIHSRISNSVVEIIKGTCHVPFLTKVDKFNQILEKWIRRL
ncbi:MAG: alpha/beta hydrolase [Candidatus Omnitrophica bacterium]|nr:alpha/beta hydrolase [Candidatus Omnitrophota bacterium]